MRKTWKLNLRLFGEGGGAAGGAGAGNAGDSSADGTTATEGVQILSDGTRVDQRLAERMEKQRARHPEKYAGIASRQAETGEQATGNQEKAETAGQGNGAAAQAGSAKTPEQEFDELIKGKYAKQYQQRIQNTISERFKNQADNKAELDALKPMLDALAKQNGIKAGDWKALSEKILDDDSLYEEEAEEKGMTIEGLKTFKRMENQYEEMRQREQESQEQMMIRNHLQNLANQGEELKKIFPNFDLMTELNNPQFRRMTAPDGGCTVEQAYYALHYREIAPQAMAAGVQKAQRQIAQSIQANAARPVEGAIQGSTAAAEVHVSPRQMTRAQREELKMRWRRGEDIRL